LGRHPMRSVEAMVADSVDIREAIQEDTAASDRGMAASGRALDLVSDQASSGN
jgi:hypothetical protein